MKPHVHEYKDTGKRIIGRKVERCKHCRRYRFRKLNVSRDRKFKGGLDRALPLLVCLLLVAAIKIDDKDVLLDDQGSLQTAISEGKIKADPGCTVAVIPDTQNYTLNGGSYQGYFLEQTEWLVANKEELGIVFVSHLGDAVNTALNDDEWTRVDTAMEELDGEIPYSIVPGNHDYDASASGLTEGEWDTGALTKFLGYFDSTRFASDSTYLEHDPNREGTWANRFDCGNREILHIGLDYFNHNASVQWAQEIINENRGLPTIISTHYHYAPFPEGWNEGRVSASGWTDANLGQDLYDGLIAANPQIFMVLSGHLTGEAHQVTTQNGRSVIEYVLDYQGWAEGGGGHLDLITFDLDANRINHKTYDAHDGHYLTKAQSQFQIEYDFGTEWEYTTYLGDNYARRDTLKGLWAIDGTLKDFAVDPNQAGDNTLDELQGTFVAASSVPTGSPSGHDGVDCSGATDTEIATPENTDFESGDFALTCWIYPDTLAAGDHYIHNNSTGATGYGTWVDNTGAVTFHMGIVDEVSAGAEITTGSWQHIAFTHAAYEGNSGPGDDQLIMYINGEQPATCNSAATCADADGGWSETSTNETGLFFAPSPFDGKVYECAVFTEYLDQFDVCRICRCGMDGRATDRDAACGSCTMSTPTCGDGG